MRNRFKKTKIAAILCAITLCVNACPTAMAAEPSIQQEETVPENGFVQEENAIEETPQPVGEELQPDEKGEEQTPAQTEERTNEALIQKEEEQTVTMTPASSSQQAEQKNGFVKAENGSYYYYMNDKVVTGINVYENEETGEIWYVNREGKADFTYSGFVNTDGKWFYVKNGKIGYDITGVFSGTVNGVKGQYYVRENQLTPGPTVVNSSNGWVYIDKNGKTDPNYTGFAKNSSGIWYVTKGKVAFDTTDVVCATNTSNSGLTKGGWYNVVKDKAVKGVTVAKNKNGWWYIDKNGRVDFSYTGFAKNGSGTWYVTKGKVAFDTTGVIKAVNVSNSGLVKGTWYNVVKDKFTRGATVAHNSNGWWYIDKHGRVDFKYTGFAKNKNGWWYCQNGKVTFKKTGIVNALLEGKGWSNYYVVKSKLSTDYVSGITWGITNLLSAKQQIYADYVHVEGASKSDYEKAYRKAVWDKYPYSHGILYMKTCSLNDAMKTYSKNMGITIYVDDIKSAASQNAYNKQAAARWNSNAGVSSKTNKWTAAKKINQYIGSHTRFANGYDGAYNVFAKGKGVCNSYAEAYYDMCKAAGIPCRIVVGLSYDEGYWDTHAWNQVKISGTWYYIDPCWSDTAGGYGLTTKLWSDHKVEYILD